MKNHKFSFIRFSFYLFFVSSVFLIGCTGERCAATSNPATDVDADCVLDEADNCPEEANTSQIDVDEDGLGLECDANDSDATITVLVKDLSNFTTEQDLEIILPRLFKTSLPDNSQTLLSRDDIASSIIDENGDTLAILTKNKTLIVSYDFFENTNDPHSSFNDEAQNPPHIINTAGSTKNLNHTYFTTNSNIKNRIDSCDFFEEQGIALPQNICTRE